MIEDGAYRRMLDLYYASEKPLPLDLSWLCRLMRAERDEERTAVEFILSHYFQKTVDGWRSKRADTEIVNARKRTKVARSNGKRGGRPITQRVISGLAKEKLGQQPGAKLPIPIPNPIPNPNINTNAGASRLNGAHHEKVADSTPTVMALPLRDGGDFEVKQSLVAELEPLYPHVDIPATLREMRGWLVLNAERRKTKRGVRKFIGNWLQSEEEKHGG